MIQNAFFGNATRLQRALAGAVLACILVSVPLGCRRKTSPPPPPSDSNTSGVSTDPANSVVATVNNQVITEKDVAEQVKAKMAEVTGSKPLLPLANLQQREKEFTKEITDTLVAKVLLNEQVQRQNITVSDAEVAERLENIPKPATLTADAFSARVREDLAWRKLFEKQYVGKIGVTNAEIQAYYNTHRNEFDSPEQIRASHIQLKAGNRATAQTLLTQLKNGADIAALAKAHSTDQHSVSKGGDIGFFKKGDMEAAFEKAAFSLQPGQLSDIVETGYGLHILKVTDRRPGKSKSLTEATEEIRTKLIEAKKAGVRRAYVRSLREQANISYTTP